MPDHFDFTIPLLSSDPLELSLSVGNVYFVVGGNGCGKSGLLTFLAQPYRDKTKRISAQRQTWLNSGMIDINPQMRMGLENDHRVQDSQWRARHLEWNPTARAQMALYDLLDSDTRRARSFTTLTERNELTQAANVLTTPSPIKLINEIFRLSNLSIQIQLDAEWQQLLVTRKNGAQYRVDELSDGERNALLLASEVLTARPGTLLLIDEPERHLHRSIATPLLRHLFALRKDCAIVVSTHELTLPQDTNPKMTFLVRDCDFQSTQDPKWQIDVLGETEELDDQLRETIVGARQKIVFVEGKSHSLDKAIYSIAFPDATIVPRETCRDVEYSVRGVRASKDLHWVSAWGIIDRDLRNEKDIERLKKSGILALPYFSVESLYYHPKILTLIAERQEKVLTGLTSSQMLIEAQNAASSAVRERRTHLITTSVQRIARQNFLAELPRLNDVKNKEVIEVFVDINSIRKKEETLFDRLLDDNNLEALLARYPLRESSALNRIASALQYPSRAVYESAVLRLLQDDKQALALVVSFFGDLYSQINASDDVTATV